MLLWPLRPEEICSKLGQTNGPLSLIRLSKPWQFTTQAGQLTLDVPCGHTHSKVYRKWIDKVFHPILLASSSLFPPEKDPMSVTLLFINESVAI